MDCNQIAHLVHGWSYVKKKSKESLGSIRKPFSDFSFLQSAPLDIQATQSLTEWIPVTLPPGLKQVRPEAVNSSFSSSEVKN